MPSKTLTRDERFDLGLAISAATLSPGQCRSQRELERFCGVDYTVIARIEREALSKVRDALPGEAQDWSWPSVVAADYVEQEFDPDVLEEIDAACDAFLELNI